MPKRKNCENIDKIARKLRKLERKLKKSKSRRKRIISSSSEQSLRSPEKQKDGENKSPMRENTNNDLDSILLELPEVDKEGEAAAADPPTDCLRDDSGDCIPTLDDDVLEIPGQDPSITPQYGKEIRPEVAARFEHIAINGLNKDTRKELCDKYLIPANSTLIGAPALNLEIKAALTEPVIKRDKLIEARQKRLAAAIACLGEAVTHALQSKEKDVAQLKLLMDAGRLVCDAQNNESVSRRNLAIYSLKREMKEPLLNTKIDKALFSENLSDSIKAAKAVTKSGTELRTPAPNKNTSTKATASKNWKPPVVGRRPPTTHRSRGPAAPMAPAQPPPLPPPPPAQSSARAYSSRPPPPPPTQYRETRRRY